MLKRLLISIVILLMLPVLFGCSKKNQTVDDKKTQEAATLKEATDYNTSQATNSESNNSSSNSDKTDSSFTLNDILPNKVDLRLTYKGGFENGGEISYVEFINGNKIQIRTVNSGTAMVTVYEKKQDGIYIVFQKGEVYEVKNFINTPSNTNKVFIKAPMKVGTTWNVENGSTAKIIAVNHKLKTAVGTLDTVVITSEKDGCISTQYIGKNLGIVKNSFKTGNNEFVTELVDIKENSPVTTSVRIYYYDAKNDKIFYKDFIKKGEGTALINSTIMNELTKSPKNEINATLPNGVKIKSIKTIPGKDQVVVDLPQNFVKNMNAGSGVEINILQCIVNTVGYNYKVNSVIITLDGKPYESGHISMKAGESFNVDYSNCNKL